MLACVRARTRVRGCVGACVRACVGACVRACVRAVQACARVEWAACGWERHLVHDGLGILDFIEDDLRDQMLIRQLLIAEVDMNEMPSLLKARRALHILRQDATHLPGCGMTPKDAPSWRGAPWISSPESCLTDGRIPLPPR